MNSRKRIVEQLKNLLFFLHLILYCLGIPFNPTHFIPFPQYAFDILTLVKYSEALSNRAHISNYIP